MKYSLLIFLALLATGCASTTGYRPVVDTYGDRNAYRLNQDASECQQLANESSVGKGVATEGLTGALIGGALGAATGAIVGNPATGAALGGTIGGIGGATKGGIEADQTYKRIYRNCMHNRGHNVLD